MTTRPTREIIARFSVLRLTLALGAIGLGFFVVGRIIENPEIVFSPHAVRSNPHLMIGLAVAFLLHATARTAGPAIASLRIGGAAVVVEGDSIVCCGMQIRRFPIGQIDHVRLEPPLRSAELGAALHKLTFHLEGGSRIAAPVGLWATKRSEVVIALERLGVTVRQDATKEQLAK